MSKRWKSVALDWQDQQPPSNNWGFSNIVKQLQEGNSMWLLSFATIIATLHTNSTIRWEILLHNEKDSEKRGTKQVIH